MNNDSYVNTINTLKRVYENLTNAGFNVLDKVPLIDNDTDIANQSFIIIGQSNTTNIYTKPDGAINNLYQRIDYFCPITVGRFELERNISLIKQNLPHIDIEQTNLIDKTLGFEMNHISFIVRFITYK